MWTSKSKLRTELIETLKRENAALRALLSASGIAFPDLTPSPQLPKRPIKKRTASDVYHATRETRLATQLKREQEQEDQTTPASPDPSASSNA